MDWVHGILADGRQFRILTVVAHGVGKGQY